MDIVHPFLKELGERYVPDEWTAEYVMQRMIESFDILRSQPIRARPGSGSGFWPSYPYEWEDIVAQQENVDLDPESTPPRASADQISAMNEALYWPAEYLKDDLNLAQAVSAWTIGKSCGITERRIAKREGMNAHTLRARAMRGFTRIARLLDRDQVPIR